jgi:hypothetical protein
MGDRVKENMTTLEVIQAMSGGNPGAVAVCCELIKDGGKIDPDDLFAGFGSILILDTLGIYESRIWMLYKDVCGEDLTKLIAVLRAWQLGQLVETTEDKINQAVDNHGEGLDVEAVLEAVKVRLPRFGEDSGAKEN